MKTVLLLLTTDLFSLPLIRYLVWEGRRYRWKTCIGSMLDHDANRIREEKFSNDLIFISITNLKQCDHAIRKADLVVGILPQPLLFQVMARCIVQGKSLITPSTINPETFSGRFRTKEPSCFILSECGFSPGLDHVTARKAIETIQRKGGKILSFKTFSGSLVSTASIDNPWEFKLTEPCQTLMNLGKNNNRHLIRRQIQHVPYNQLFSRAKPIVVPGLDNTVAIPEGDSLYYQRVYGLKDVDTIVKGKIMRSGFEKIWDMVIKLGLTNTQMNIDLNGNASYYDFLNSLLPFSERDSLEYRLMKYMNADANDIKKLKWLGLFNKESINRKGLTTPAAILHDLLEENLLLKPEDKDCIVMQHLLEYTYRNTLYNFQATLVAGGENLYDSAIAKAIGLTIGAAAKAYLIGNIKSRGFHLPVSKEIYDPVLEDLDELGIDFQINEKKVYSKNQDINLNLNLN